MLAASRCVLVLACARDISQGTALTDWHLRSAANKSSVTNTNGAIATGILHHEFNKANREYQSAETSMSWSVQDLWQWPRSTLYRLADFFGLAGSQVVKSPKGLSLTEWASQTVPNIPVLSIDSTLKPLDHVMEKRLPAADGLFLEFGVFSGDSIRRIAAHAPDGCKVYGFDSFVGLPEDFTLVSGDVINKRVFDVHGHLPEVPSNVELVQGWFNETLPKFLRERPHVPLSLLHIDSDLYSSAKYVLDAVSDRIRPGTVIVFDELINYPNYHQEELKALYEALNGGALSQHRSEWIGSMCPPRLTPSPVAADWGPCCAVALRVVT